MLGGISISTLSYTVKRYEQEGTTKSLPRSGRPQLFTQQDERAILRLIRADRGAPYHAIASRSGMATTHQVSEIANRANYHHCVARRKPFISEPTTSKRRTWSKDNKDRKWSGVLWTDEVSMETGERPGRKMVTRQPGEENLPKCILPTFCSGRQSLMAWSCVAQDWKGPLVWLETQPKPSTSRACRLAEGLLLKVMPLRLSWGHSRPL